MTPEISYNKGNRVQFTKLVSMKIHPLRPGISFHPSFFCVPEKIMKDGVNKLVPFIYFVTQKQPLTQVTYAITDTMFYMYFIMSSTT